MEKLSILKLHQKKRKRNRFRDDFRNMWSLLEENQVKLHHFLLPVSFLAMAGILEGFYIALFAPLAQGILHHNFEFLEKIPVLRNLQHHSLLGGEEHFIRTFILLSAIMIACNVLKHMSSYFSGFFSDRLNVRYLSSIQNRVLARFLSFGQAFYDLNQMGQLRLMLWGLTLKTSKAIFFVQRICQNIIMLTVYLVIMFSISWRLTLLSLCVIPLIYYPVYYIARKIRLNSIKQVNLQMDAAKKVFSILGSIPLIKIYSQEDQERKIFKASNEKAIMNDISMMRLTRLSHPIQDLFLLLSTVVLIGLMSFYFIESSPYRITLFVAFLVALRKAMHVIRKLNGERIPFAKLQGPVSRLKQIMKDDGKYMIKSGSKSFEGLKKNIRIENLSFDYPNREGTLKKLNLEIKKGQMTAIVGPTGAGKSTIANLLVRFYDYSQGHIYFDETDITEFEIQSYLKHVTYIPQQCILVLDTLRNNLCYGLENISEGELREACRKVGLLEFIEGLPSGFDTMIRRSSGQFSQGQKQRLSLARGLLKSSDILIFDEPLSALNTKAQEEMVSTIEEMARGKTSIVISHNLFLNQKADKILVLKDGQLVEEGCLDDLVAAQGTFYTDCFKKGYVA